MSQFLSKENFQDGLFNIENRKDKTIFTHIQNVTPILEKASRLRKLDGKGFNKKKDRQLIGTIPEIVFLQHPEFISDPKSLLMFLNSEEGKCYRTVDNRV